MKVSVIGYGKVGKPMVEAFREKGHEVVAIDKQLNIGAVADFNFIKDTEITFIIVPTPSNEDGSFSMKNIMDALFECDMVLKRKPHLFVVNSTISPGSMELLLSSGYDFCYNPFFIRLGSVKEDILYPRFILIGSNHENTLLDEFYRDWDAPKIKMNFINAELTKLALNTFTTVKMSFANSLARLCEKLPGADIDRITDTLQLWGSIGKGNITAGARYGGPCLPRDNRALLAVASKYGVDLPLAEGADKINHDVTEYLVKLIKKNLPEQGMVHILGLAYKLGSDWMGESQGLVLADRLNELKIDVNVSEDLDLQEGDIVAGDVVVVTLPRSDFRKITQANLKENATIIDCWRILDGSKFKNYIALGKYV